MAFYRTLISSLRRNSNIRHRLLSSSSSCHLYSDAVAATAVATSTTSSFSSSSLPCSTFALRCGSSHIPLPFPRWPSFPPLSGPLFLSLPPWKLSQSATPLYLRGKDGIFPTDLLQVRSFPLELVSLKPAGKIGRSYGDAVGWSPKEEAVEEVAKALEKDKFLNLPNLISISRMVSGPAIAWLIIHDMYLPAFGALALAGATDWLDGFLARKMAINSVFGSYLDPLADKVLIGSVALAMVEKDLLHPGLVSLVVLRDVALVSGALYKRASTLGWEWKSWSEFVNLDTTFQKKVEPLFISKVNTVFQLLLVAAALLQPELGSEHTQIYISYLSWLVASTTVASSVGYGLQHLRHK